MEREKNFYQIFIMFLFVTCFTTCYILSNRIIEFGGFIATASSIIYPLTYFIAILFYERYGKNRTFELINFSVISLIFMGLMIALAGTFDVYQAQDGLEKIFNIDFRILFSSVVAFVTGQYINIKLYDFLGTKKGFDFLIAGAISITIDSFLFIGLSYLGVATFEEVLKLATGQYILSIIAILIYTLCFNALITTLLETKEKKIKDEIKDKVKIVEPKKVVKKATTKKTVKKDETKKEEVKKTTSKKTTKKTTDKKETPKKTTTRKTVKKEEK